MHDLSLLDETLDINITRSYHLSIQIDLNGFSFCILDSTRNKYVALNHYSLKKEEEAVPEEIREIFGKDEFLNQEYKSVKIIWQSERSTLVPEPLFNKENLNDYFTFNHPKREGEEEIIYNRIRTVEAYVVFTVPGYLPGLVQ